MKQLHEAIDIAIYFYSTHIKEPSEKDVACYNRLTKLTAEWLDEQPIPKDDYWKKRCEAAEDVLDSLGIDEYFNTYKLGDASNFKEEIELWQQLKSSPSPEKKYYPITTGDINVQEGLREADKIRKEHGAYIWAFPIKYRSEAGLVYQEDYGWEIEFEDGKCVSYGYSGEPTVPNYESALLQAIEYFYKQAND